MSEYATSHRSPSARRTPGLAAMTAFLNVLEAVYGSEVDDKVRAAKCAMVVRMYGGSTKDCITAYLSPTFADGFMAGWMAATAED